MNHTISEALETRYVNAAITAAAATDDNSARIDMSGYESALFIVPITDSADTGVATMIVQSNTVDSDTGMTAISGAVATATSAANDDLNGTVLMVEVRNPAKRFIQATLTSATANIAFGDTVVLLKPRRLPATQGATVAASAVISD